MTERSFNMSPKSKEQFENIRENMKRVIKDVALELFAQRGFYATSVSKIAEKAGISKGLLYNYYDSKESLLDELFEEATAVGDKMLEESFAGGKNDPSAVMGKLIDSIFDYAQENPEYLKLMTAISFQEDIVKRLENKIQKKQKQSLEITTEQLRKLNIPNPEMETLFIGAILDGIVFHSIFMGKNYPFEKMRKFLKQKLNYLNQ